MQQTSTIHFLVISLLRLLVVSLSMIHLISKGTFDIFSFFLVPFGVLEVFFNLVFFSLLSIYLKSTIRTFDLKSNGSHIICDPSLHLLRLQSRQVAETLYRLPKQDLRTSASRHEIL